MNRKARSRVTLFSIAAAMVSACDQAPATDSSGILQPMPVPAASGSQGPNLAVGPDGLVVLSWLAPEERGHRLQYAVLQESGWNEPVDIARGDNWFVNWADFPSVVPVSDELWAAHWLVRQPAGGYAYDVALSVSSDGGASWSDTVTPHDDHTPTEHGFVTLFPQGSGFGLIWLDGRNMANDAPRSGIQGMTLRAATYSPSLEIANEALVDELICDCCQTDVAITPGAAFAVYRNRTNEETRDIHFARYMDGEWLSGGPVAEDGWTIDGCPVNGPVIAAEGDRIAVAWFTAAGDEAKVRLARSSDSGKSWSAPVDVTQGDVFGRAGVAMLEDGDVAVSWLCKESENRAQVCLRRVGADDALGKVFVASGNQEVPPLSVPQLARHGNAIIAAWTVRDGSGTGIRSGRIAVDALR
jgi:hypothetical protein